MKYLFIVNYSNEIIGEDKPADEYQGRIRTLTKSLDGLNDKVNSIQGDMNQMKNQLTFLVDSMKNKY